MSVFCVYLPELCRGLFFLYMLLHVHTFACNVRRREWKDGVTSTSMCANLRCILFLITIDYAFLSNLLLTSFQHKSRCWFIIYSVYRILWTMIADIKCWLRKKKNKICGFKGAYVIVCCGYQLISTLSIRVAVHGTRHSHTSYTCTAHLLHVATRSRTHAINEIITNMLDIQYIYIVWFYICFIQRVVMIWLYNSYWSPLLTLKAFNSIWHVGLRNKISLNNVHVGGNSTRL